MNCLIFTHVWFDFSLEDWVEWAILSEFGFFSYFNMILFTAEPDGRKCGRKLESSKNSGKRLDGMLRFGVRTDYEMYHIQFVFRGGGKLVTKTVENSESQQSGQCIERASKRKTERHTPDPLKKKEKKLTFDYLCVVFVFQRLFACIWFFPRSSFLHSTSLQQLELSPWSSSDDGNSFFCDFSVIISLSVGFVNGGGCLLRLFLSGVWVLSECVHVTCICGGF